MKKAKRIQCVVEFSTVTTAERYAEKAKTLTRATLHNIRTEGRLLYFEIYQNGFNLDYLSIEFGYKAIKILD